MLSSSKQGAGMKKIIAGIVLLLIIAGVCAPFVNGLVMEKIVKQSRDNLNEMYADTGSGMSIEIIKYDRKFSSSEIEWSLKFGSLATLYDVDEIILVDRAKHGFTGVVSQTSLERNPWFINLLNENLDGKNPLSITTTFHLSGNIESVIDIGAFSFNLDNETVDIRPGRVVTEVAEGLTLLTSEATWEGVSVSDKFWMSGFSQALDLEKISTYIWDGEISYEVENIKIKDQEENFELTNFKGTYTLDLNKEKNILSTGGTVAIGNLAAGNKRAEDTFIRLGINNIDAVGYEEFMKLYTQAMNSLMNDISAVKENPKQMDQALEQKATAIGLQMMAASEKFLKKGLEIKISDLHAQLPEGKITGNMELKLTQDITFAQLVPIAMQPNLAFNMLSLQSDLSFPAKLAGDTTKLVLPAFEGMQTGLFVVDGENLVHSAQTKDGKLLLNGYEVVFNKPTMRQQ
jgi:uncharacterized protein YdgA (DUF945 family)